MKTFKRCTNFRLYACLRTCFCQLLLRDGLMSLYSPYECAFAELGFVYESSSLLAFISFLGQMIWLRHCSHLLFMSSPLLVSLDDLRNLKVYLSDIPLYDVTRELVLLNQQRIVEIDVAWVYACVRCWVILLLCVLLPRLNSYVFFLALCLFYQWQHNSIGAIGVCVHIINSHENCECM